MDAFYLDGGASTVATLVQLREPDQLSRGRRLAAFIIDQT